MSRPLFAVSLLSLAACSKPELGADVFTVSGDVMITGRLGTILGSTKFAAFYTGQRLFTGATTFEEGDPTEIVSNVVDLGRTVDKDVPFSLDFDLTELDEEGDTVTLAAWVDDDSDDEPDVGELRTRLLANLTTGCPVFGSANSLIPIHFTHMGDPVPLLELAGGWHQQVGVDYVPAVDAQGAHIESEYNFVP